MSVFQLLHEKLREKLPSLGYERPLPIQEKAIPVVLTGSNTLIMAPTGSGKTEAAVLPVVSMLLGEIDEKGEIGGVRALYVTPLRALNRDVTLRITRIAESVGLRVLLRHGDTTQASRREFLENPPHIAVTTPESLNLLVSLEKRDRLWRNLRWVIVDEVHELVDNKRGAELSVVLERLQKLSRFRVQRIGLSATLSKATAREASRMIAGNRRVSIVEDSSTKKYSIEVEVVRDDDGFWLNSAKRIIEISKSTPGSVLVFTNTRGTAERLASTLRRIAGEEGLNFRVEVHHGSLSRKVREEVEAGFRKGEIKILVATSSMELGIDIGHVDLVIQFMSPRQVIAMTQRAGRAGHRIDEVSRGVIVTSSNLFELLESGIIAVRSEKGHLEDQFMPKNSYDVASHQIAGIVVEERGSTPEAIADIFWRSGSLNGLTMEEIESILDHLDSVGVVRWDPESRRVRLGRRTFSYFYRVSMIPDESSFHVYDVITGSRIGEVSERFVESSMLRSGTPKLRFVLGGKVWEAVSVDYERGRIEAMPLMAEEALVPSWEGEIIPVSYKVAREACAILSLCQYSWEECRRALEYRKIRGAWAERIYKIIKDTIKALGEGSIGPRTALVEEVQGVSILYSCLGSKGNLALALLLSRLMERRTRVEFDYIPYAIVFRSPTGVPQGLVQEAIEEARRLDRVERIVLLQDAVKSSRTYLIRFIRVAKRMGLIEPDKRLPLEFARRLAENLQGSLVEAETIRELLHEKLDAKALNDYLDDLREVRSARVSGPTPLAREVLENPYIKRDIAVKITKIAMDKIVESLKKAAGRREVIMLCVSCGHHWRMKASDVEKKFRCPKCGSLALAPLPATEYGESLLNAYLKYKRGARLRGEEKKLVKEVKERAILYLNYAGQGLARYVVESLMTYGVGPQRAKRLLAELASKGERGFYQGLLKAMEEYAANRQYWKAVRRASKKR